MIWVIKKTGESFKGKVKEKQWVVKVQDFQRHFFSNMLSLDNNALYKHPLLATSFIFVLFVINLKKYISQDIMKKKKRVSSNICYKNYARFFC